MAFGGPEAVLFAMKALRRHENRNRVRPIFQILAHPAADRLAAVAVVQIITAAAQQDIRVAAIDLLRELRIARYRAFAAARRDVHIGYLHLSLSFARAAGTFMPDIRLRRPAASQLVMSDIFSRSTPSTVQPQAEMSASDVSNTDRQ